MGISGLYKYLSTCVQPSHIKYYSGKSVAVDMPCWVHRGAIADAQKIVTGPQDVKSEGTGSFKFSDFLEKKFLDVKMTQNFQR